MNNLSPNLRSPRGYRRITPLDVSTVLWLNDSAGMSGQDKNSLGNDTQEAPATGIEQDDRRASTEPEGLGTRISKTALNAARAVNRHYIEQLMRNRSRSSGPQ